MKSQMSPSQYTGELASHDLTALHKQENIVTNKQIV